MGKGDVKTKKGKISMGTYGVRRLRSANKTVVVKSKTKSKKSKPKAKPKVEETVSKPKTKVAKKK